MPTLQIFTNVKEGEFPDGFFAGLSSVFQKAIGKPEKYICIHVVPNQMMSFGGSTEPCAIANVTSIGKLGVEENKVLTQVITTEMLKIGVNADRMYVVFRDAARQDIGWNNTTFAS
ncbi:macrophage migration inhibitory factor-like [Lytechinus pictus]|uniref:macrophage migration inhibitory factor-like n=1 Tax=Lytechinus variegatus TaxID=7654 RepID=UPI001BB0FFCA|nr:macrophage migration inhibitory factor-like [Lytechinus variegatus]XP_054767494.1 macrophage migration inhibitory factor-like [Lytechinus pictus]